jgi:hypothetical protein
MPPHSDEDTTRMFSSLADGDRILAPRRGTLQ